MVTERSTALLDQFRRHRNVALLEVHSAETSLTARRTMGGPAVPTRTAQPLPTLDVTAATVGVVGLSLPDAARIAVGSIVRQGQLLCRLTTAGRVSDVVAPATGTVVEISVVDQQFVEFGEPLLCLRTDTAATGANDPVTR